MRVHRCDDVEEFLSLGGDFLATREAEHNLVLGVCSRLRRDPRSFGARPYLAVVRDDEEGVAAVAMRTPPYNLVLSEMDDLSSVEPIALDAHDADEALPGVLGPREAAAAFARAWERITGVPARRTMAQRIYRARSVTAPAAVPGRMRRVEEPDRDLVLAWLEAFQAEALAPDAPREDMTTVLDRRLSGPDGGLHVWDDDGPVSLAGYSGPTPNGIRVGPVYTPPELRGRGYATALVARMTELLLEEGREFCFLFTDLGNPISNDIYRRIGYRPVTDVDQYAFG